MGTVLLMTGPWAPATPSGEVDLAATIAARARYLEQLRLHARIVDRDESALLECFDRFGHVVYCALREATRDPALAEDLTEQLFVLLWRDAKRFHPNQGPIALQLLATLPTSSPGPGRHLQVGSAR